MKELGGYIELERNCGEMLYDDGIKLNCGRNALAYLILAKGIKKLAMPYFMCDSCDSVLREQNVSVRRYSVGWDLKPVSISLDKDEWLYLVNFYGQLSNTFIRELVSRYGRVIIDNVQAYFQPPVPGVDTIYSCRKFFGVPDGAVLFTQQKLEDDLEQDESFERMRFLLGRFERTASEFYPEYVANNEIFSREPIKRMSRLTENLLRGISYEAVKQRRTENYSFLHEVLKSENGLEVQIPEGPFMYPFYTENGTQIRKELQKKKVFVPMLWPNVLEAADANAVACRLAENVLPLPCDQRYTEEDMKYMSDVLQMEMEKTGTPKNAQR